MSNPERRAIRYESDVDSLWTAINKTVDTYAWLAGLCNVGMHPAEDIKIDMLYGSVPYEIGRTSRIVANRSQDPVVVKNAIRVSLESADDVGSWLIGARGGEYTPNLRAARGEYTPNLRAARGIPRRLEWIRAAQSQP